MRYEVKAFAGELQSLEQSMHEFVADRVVADISFQDMASIARAMKQYFGRELNRSVATNDVIVAHAARHVIVHSGVAADSRFMKQIRDCTPRAVLPAIREGDRIQFSASDVKLVSEAMDVYLSDIAAILRSEIGA
jgi:hypothetical protein